MRDADHTRYNKVAARRGVDWRPAFKKFVEWSNCRGRDGRVYYSIIIDRERRRRAGLFDRRKIIEMARADATKIVKKYGGNVSAITEIPVYFDDLAKGVNGSMNPQKGIRISNRVNQKTELYLAVIHEFFHTGSYRSTHYNETDGRFYTRRGGLEVDFRDTAATKPYFGYLDEAAVETMVAIYYSENEDEIRKKLGLKPVFPSHRNKMLKIYKENRLERLDNIIHSELGDFGFSDNTQITDSGRKFLYHSYVYERAALFMIVSKIAAGECGLLDIYDEFFRAMFSGKIAPLRRLVEDHLGPGSFMKIGRITRERGFDMLNELEDFLESK